MNKFHPYRLLTWSKVVLASSVHSSAAALSLDISGNLLSIGKAAIEGDREKLERNIKERGVLIDTDNLVGLLLFYSNKEIVT